MPRSCWIARWRRSRPWPRWSLLEADSAKTIFRAPFSRVTFSGPKRSLDQNSKLWAMLTDISEQVEHKGMWLAPEDWKDLFMHALHQELRYLPALSGVGVVPVGRSTSNLSKEQFRDLIEVINAWGAQHRVVFTDARPRKQKWIDEEMARQQPLALEG